MLCSFVYFFAVTFMIDAKNGVHFADFGKVYGTLAELVIDILMYLQMILGTLLIFLYTYRMDN